MNTSLPFHASQSEKTQQLVDLALQKLLLALRNFGNQISQVHECALRELLSGLAEQALGVGRGRNAYALPCGAGKTQSVVALIAAAYELGISVSFAVSAAQILALGRLKSDLVKAGVPSALVGLKHSKNQKELEQMAKDAGAPELLEFLADTGEVEFPIMLLCHARIRGAREFPAFCRYQEKPRDLLIWDETLMTTDAQALSVLDVKTSMERITPELGPQSVLREVLRQVEVILQEEIAGQRLGSQPTSELFLSGCDITSARLELKARGTYGGRMRVAAIDTVNALLKLVELPFSVALTGNGETGDGLIRYTVAVDPEMSNIAILDASHPVRLLAQGPSIKDRTTEAMRTCKRYDNVTVTQHRIAAGKTTLLNDKANVKSLALQVAHDIRSQPESLPILIVTHKGDANKVLENQMRMELEAEGIDTLARVDGAPRLNWLTWGNETSINTMKHCGHVIFCGILRRNSLELAASMAGQREDLSYRMTRGELKGLVVSEMAHCVLQGMSRGRCRDVVNGVAPPMTLTIFDREDGLREALLPHLPGINWEVLESTNATSRTHTAARQVCDYLQALPLESQSISIQKLKQELCIPLCKESMAAAIDEALLLFVMSNLKSGLRWQRLNRSLVRVRII